LIIIFSWIDKNNSVLNVIYNFSLGLVEFNQILIDSIGVENTLVQSF
jgi:hypothetical protein